MFLSLCFYTLSKRKFRGHLKKKVASCNKGPLLVSQATWELHWLLVLICQSFNHTTHAHAGTFLQSPVYMMFTLNTVVDPWTRVCTMYIWRRRCNFVPNKPTYFYAGFFCDVWAVKGRISGLIFWYQILKTWVGIQSWCVQPVYAEPCAMHCGKSDLTFHPGRDAAVFHINWSLLLYSILFRLLCWI